MIHFSLSPLFSFFRVPKRYTTSYFNKSREHRSNNSFLSSRHRILNRVQRTHLFSRISSINKIYIRLKLFSFFFAQQLCGCEARCVKKKKIDATTRQKERRLQPSVCCIYTLFYCRDYAAANARQKADDRFADDDIVMSAIGLFRKAFGLLIHGISVYFYVIERSLNCL